MSVATAGQLAITAPRACVGYSPARLAAAEAAHRVNCTWVCIRSALHCVSHAHAGFKAQWSHLNGREWEASCKAEINARFDLERKDAVVAGLFSGDYLPLLSAKVGRTGTVYGFEPTDAVDVSRALADANVLTNVKIQQACLSNDSSVVRMCMRNPRLNPGETYSVFGDRTHMLRVDEEQHDRLGGARCGNAHSKVGRHQTGGFVQMRCVVLDEVLPWQSTEVGFLLLDVEGAEEKVLWGAAGLTRRWRPVIATEPRIERDSQRLFEHHLAPLGYGYRGTCDGLNFYVP